ncbi:hypothetical protein ACFLXV_02685, partial [Chloroflexota bacterium]
YNCLMLLDKYIRDFQFNEVHQIAIGARPQDIYPSLKRIDFSRSKVIKLLFTIRGLPKRMCSLEGFVDVGFILLEENDGEELVIGAIFHPLKFRPVAVSPNEFIEFNEKDHVKAVMNFLISEIDENRSLLTTESRVFCTSGKARLLFTPYWWLIRRFSGLIRIKMLQLIKQEAEKSSQ